MQVINIHKRLINQPIAEVSQLFQTLGTPEDKIWPNKNWPEMRFKTGMTIGNKGGHGQIRYTIIDYKPRHYIKFQFTKPKGFNGTHELEITSVSERSTTINHAITMHTTSLKSTFLWVFVIRYLHDALIEEAFDILENYYSSEEKITTYSAWVTLLRGMYKSKSVQLKQA
jgi:hypothetical protein